MVCSPVRRAHAEADALARPPLHPEDLGRKQHLDPFVPKICRIASATSGILATGELRPVLDDRHAAAEAAVRLRQFEADIAAAEHDEVRGQAVELERLDMRERLGSGQAGNRRDRGVRAHIEEHAIARQHVACRRRSNAPRASSARRTAPCP